MRLKSAIWVAAYLKRAQLAGAFAGVVQRGDDAAGAIFIKINRLDGTADLFAPAMPSLDAVSSERRWELRKAIEAEYELDGYLLKERQRDPDAWFVEVEHKEGLHFLLSEERAVDQA